MDNASTVSGLYFPPRNSRRFTASLTDLGHGQIRIEASEEELSQNWAWKDVELSDRMGNMARKLQLPDGGLFETQDNDSVDIIDKKYRRVSTARVLHHLERHTKVALAAVLIAIGFIYAFAAYGVPYFASALAERTPVSVDTALASKTLEILDYKFFQPSELSKKEEKRAKDLFEETLDAFPGDTSRIRLEFRQSKLIGPNALALPDGTIVMTDEMWRFFEHDDEAVGVFAHEIGHVEKRHSLRALYQVSFIAGAVAVIAGDLSQVAELAVAMPALLLQTAYSRGFETEADLVSRDVMLKMKRNPAHLANALKRLERWACEKKAGNTSAAKTDSENTDKTKTDQEKTPPLPEKTAKTEEAIKACLADSDWLSTHPGAKNRAAILTGEN